MAEQYIITGNINAAEGVDRNGIRIQAFDRDLPSLERRSGASPPLLGEARADAEGRFQITYTLEQFSTGEAVSQFRRSQGKNSDISFCVFDRAGQELNINLIEALNRQYPPGQIIFNVPTPLDVSIFVEALQQAGTSEYEQLVALISPVLEDLPLIELADEDLGFLSNELGLEQQRQSQQRIEWLRLSALMAQETSLAIEAFYGWARTGLPELWNELHRLDHEGRRPEAMTKLLDELAAAEEEVLVAHLLRAIEERIIPDRFRERAGSLANAIRRRAQQEYTLSLRLEHSSEGEPLPGYLITTFDLDANNRDLGTDVTDALGEFMISYFGGAAAAERKIRFQVRGPGIAEALEVTERVRSDSPIPIGIRITLPSAQPTLRELLGDDRIQVTEAILQTLEQKHRIKDLAGIRRVGGLNRLADVRALDSVAIRRLDALADLDRLSNDLNETSVLLKHNYESVAAIAEASRSEFVASLSAQGAGLTERRATELHIAAKAQTDILDQIFAGIAMDFANGIRPPSGFAVGDYVPPFPEEQEHG